MDEKPERQLRRKAIGLLLRGIKPQYVLQQIPRSRSWLHKWYQRFLEDGWSGLRSQSRNPRQSPQQYPARVRRMVIQARVRLQRRQVGLLGPKAIQRELRQGKLLRRIPSTATIKRILREAGLIQPPHPPREVYFPQPTATVHFVLHALDWTARYLEGGAKVFAFHTLDLATRACKQTIHTDKKGPTVRTHVLKVWNTLGIPDGMQMDNDAAFCGGYKGVRVFSQLVRLCLYVGIEPIFLPVGEPERNGDIERLHGLWHDTFWKRRHFRSVAHVKRTSPDFEHWYAHTYEPPTLNGQTPAQVHQQAKRRRLTQRQIRSIPEGVPITAGRIHFIRCVSDDGTISLLNETWHVDKRLCQQYVWATIVTHEHVLNIYHRRSPEAKTRKVKTYDYILMERVVALSEPFKRPYRRRKMSTML